MDPVHKLLLELLALPIAFALFWHVVIRNFIVASILSGICAASVHVLMATDFSTFGLVWNFAMGFLPATLISLAIGIPFNRHRNPPLPAEKATTSSAGISWNRRLTWQQVVPIFVLILIFIARRVWWP